MAEVDASLREAVRARAEGRYCRIPERFTLAEHQIDHVISVKHGGQSVLENLALCCAICNRYKGSDIASIDTESGLLTPLFHPRLDYWGDHYELRDGEVFALTAQGRVTVRILRLNLPSRIRERLLTSRAT